MSKHAKYVPKHRAPATPGALSQAPVRVARTGLLLTSLAVAATGATVGGGMLGSSAADGPVDGVRTLGAASGGAAVLDAADLRDRGLSLSRSADRRASTDTLKATALADDAGPTTSGSKDLADADPREIGRALLAEFGFGAEQFGCLDSLYMRESHWNPYADNPSSSAYGIPQALPGSKMASAGADWATNPVTQIRWGLGYIRDRYGSPCGAWGHSESHGWY